MKRFSPIIAVLIALACATLAEAQSLTQAQLQTLKTAIQADGTLNGLPIDDDTSVFIAAQFNQAASPDYWVWKTSLTKAVATQQAGPDGTTFTWAGNGFITRSSGEISAWIEMWGTQGVLNPSLLNVRAAFADIFSGSGNAAANRTHLAAIGRRLGTRFEILYSIASADGTGNRGATTKPDTLVLSGPISGANVRQARELP